MLVYTKALVTVENNEIQIKLKDVNQFAPLNRVIDVSGFYQIDSRSTSNSTYILTVTKEEYYTKKTKVLFTKTSKETGIIDITEDDIEEIREIAQDIMKLDKNYLV